MAAKNNSFIFGIDTYPEWFTKADAEGRVIYGYDDNNLMSSAKMQSKYGLLSFNVGDTLLSMDGETVVVIKKEIAKKYGVI